MFKPYPIVVKPILKDEIWGGKNLKKFISIPKNKKIGAAWFMADQEGNDSIIANGQYRGISIDQLINRFPAEVLGKKLVKKYGKKFPLLFKFIDAQDRLSVQVHPDDKFAAKNEKCMGKTEMWYLMETRKGANIMIGLKKKASKSKE